MSSSKHTLRQAFFDLISSMRFAVSLLSVLAIASIIGTVLKQNEPYANYLIQFGPYWFKLFGTLGLYDVYHALWFLTILAFLVLSTGLCIWRQYPQMLREMRSYRERAGAASLALFRHTATLPLAPGVPSPAEAVAAYARRAGFTAKLSEREDGILVAAKRGAWRRLGYFLTHAAIVIICLGGLLDGNLPLKWREMTGQKVVETRDIPQSQVPPHSRLPADNASFRGNVTVPEGSSANVVFLNLGNGYLVQELPFEIHLKAFRVEYYSTGMPRSFVSDVEVENRATGRRVSGSIAVNHPLEVDGISIYQASFGDGGSRLTLRQWPLLGPAQVPATLTSAVHEKLPVVVGTERLVAEFEDFKAINVEDMGRPGARQQDVREVMSAVRSDSSLQNIGPSVTYKIRNTSGQAREYHNYMLPVTVEGRRYFLTGVRSTPNEAFQYLRLPVDAAGGLDGYMALRATLLDPARWPAIAERLAATALPGGEAEAREKLVEVAQGLLKIYSSGGYDAVARFINASVPAAEQEKAAQTYLKILDSAAWAAFELAGPVAGRIPAQGDPAQVAFVRDSLVAMSDSFLYGAPVYLQLTGFEQVLASGFQLTKSPGQNMVYLGCLLLMLGIMAMFYVREQRLFALVRPGTVLLALSSNRQTLDTERDFARLRDDITQLLKEDRDESRPG